jgi:DNA polymerase-3 subunit alpha (Gram-positive type)
METKLFSLDITDYTDSITVKLFCSQNKASDIEKKIQEGCWVRVRGNCRYDTYQREEVLMANDVMLIPPKTRLDKCEEKRVELHLHTQMSALDAVSPAFSLVERAANGAIPPLP